MIPFDKAVDMLRSLSEVDYESAANYISALSAKRDYENLFGTGR